ncbi:MAG TPA: methionine adenosyltransferase [Clostridiales bacterium]|nr:methionine adenosyltransferase [Clostridiales bacterium]
MKYLFTSESVTEGHPDKVCDQIADRILDAILSQDSQSRSACEVVSTTGRVIVVGEISTNAKIDVEKIVRQTIKDIGYTKEEYLFNYSTCSVDVYLDKQSSDIAQGVNKSLESSSGNAYDLIGAGDQGMMFGYACKESENLMPLPIHLAHKLTKRLTEVRKNKIIDYIRPDGKSQVTVEYVNNKPSRVEAVVISTQHDDNIDIGKLRNDVKKHVIEAIIPSNLIDENTKIYINPTGRFVLGGPAGDSGVTGRKIIVDTYGGSAPHGGGAFSGKDPTKVDRSATYFARYVAKHVVACDLADKCQIQIAYAIGKAQPVSVSVDTFCTGKYSDEIIADAIQKVFDFRPKAIIERFDMTKPIYSKCTNYGHFGNEDMPWEKLTQLDELKAYFTKLSI